MTVVISFLLGGLHGGSPDDTVRFIVRREETNSDQRRALFYVFHLEFTGNRVTHLGECEYAPHCYCIRRQSVLTSILFTFLNV